MIGMTLKTVLEEKNMNVNELARLANVSSQTLYSIIKRDNMKIDFDLLLKLCKVLNVSVERFLAEYHSRDRDEDDILSRYRQLNEFGKERLGDFFDILLGNPACKQQAASSRKKFYKAAYYDMPVCAGVGNPLDYENLSSIYVAEPIPARADYVLRISGDSMEPTFFDGDYIYVEKCDILGVGEIGIFVIEGNVYLKQRGENGLISHNTAYPPIEGSEDIRCLGRVIKKVSAEVQI